MRKILHSITTLVLAAICTAINASAENYPASSYTLSDDGLTLTKWLGDETIIDMNSDETLRNVTAIGNYSCNELAFEKFVVGDKVTSIGNGAFVDCTELTDVTLPEGLKTIGRAAFSTCISLPSITLPSTLTTLGASIFYGCKLLKDVELPTKVTEIPAGCFSGCVSITEINLHEGITAIGEDAFKETSLTSFTCPSTLQSIGISAFTACPKLASITFNPDLNEIGDNAFEDSALESVDLSAITYPVSIGFNAFQNCVNLKTALLPLNPSRIADGLFAFCAGLEEITIPDTYTDVPIKLCHYCTGLKKVTLGANVTRIKNTAFFSCSSLTEIVFNEKLETIDWNVFPYCTSLQSVSLPASLKTIDNELFYGCESLKTVKCAATTPPTLGANCFAGVNTAEATLYVPTESIDAYKAADQWKDFGTFADLASVKAVEITALPMENAQVFDLQGRMLKAITGVSFNDIDELDATLRSTLPAGIYIVKTSTETRKVAVK